MRLRVAGLINVVFILTACSAPQERSDGPSDPSPPDDAVVEAPAGDDALTGAVTREGLGRMLGPGPGHFFGLVTVEGVGDEATSRFQGWRIENLPTDTPGWLDVRVGDVVTGVNGITPLEQPEDAIRVYEVLRVASEVRIDLLRDGERRAVRVPILDPGDAAPESAPEAPEEGSPEEPPTAETPSSDE